MDTVRSVLAEVLPITYASIDPAGYKNVTVCPKQASPSPAYGASPNSGRRRLVESLHQVGAPTFSFPQWQGRRKGSLSSIRI